MSVKDEQYKQAQQSLNRQLSTLLELAAKQSIPMITDERLAELIGLIDGKGPWMLDGECLTTAALRELQQSRDILKTLAAQSSGVIGSASRSDCMAALAQAHLRNYLPSSDSQAAQD